MLRASFIVAAALLELTAAAVPEGKVVGQGPVPGVDLSRESVRIAVAIAPDARASLKELLDSKSPAERLVLSVDGIACERSPDFYWEVFLDLPETMTRAEIKSDHYVGNLALFGLCAQGPGEGPEAASVQFDITRAARRLRTRGRWGDERITLTFAPQLGGAHRRENLPPRPIAHLERLVLRVEPLGP
jgi:hypothetical protein